MKDNKTISILMWLASAVSLLLAIICAVFALNTESAFTKVILIAVALLFVALLVLRLDVVNAVKTYNNAAKDTVNEIQSFVPYMLF